MLTKMNYSLLIASILLAIIVSPLHAENESVELPFRMRTNHLNIVLSVADPDKTHEFYGYALGLKRIPDLNFPGKTFMIRSSGSCCD